MGGLLIRQLSMIRHSKGFGVHSPLAFEIITSVLPDKPAYYADSIINEKFRNKRQRRIARVILRLIARFKPESVFVEQLYHFVVKLADSHVKIAPEANAAYMSITTRSNLTSIRIGREEPDCGPLILDNTSDLTITVFRKGLSPTLIRTKL